MRLNDAASCLQIQGVSERERLHLEAALRLAEGSMHTACEVWEKILQSHPTDMLAIKAAHDCYFYLGKDISRLREISASVEHSTSLILYSKQIQIQETNCLIATKN